MTQRRSIHSPGSPSKTPEPKKAANPDGRTPVELPGDTKRPKPDSSPHSKPRNALK